MRPLDRLDQLAGRLDHPCGGQRLLELPIRVRVTGAALDQQVARPLGKERPQRWQPVGLVDVDPQEAGLADCVFVAARRSTNGRGDEHLFAGVGVPSGERQQWLQPVALTGVSAGQEVVRAAAGRDLQPAVAACAGRELDEPTTVLVQDTELEGPVALGHERAGEDTPVSEPDAAAQPLAVV